MPSLANQTAVITGAGSGIGRAIARKFAAADAKVEIVDVDERNANEAVGGIREAGGDAEFTTCDISDQEAVRSTIKSILKRRKQIDILVNNAGVANIGTATTTEEDDFDRVFRVNVKGAYNCLHEILPSMVEAESGVILNMSSIAAITGIPDRFAYSASKGALHTMTFSVAADYIGQGIRCNCICPARVHTPFVDGYLADNYPGQEKEMFEKLSKVQPIGRMAKPDEIAELALYLCSEDSSFISGQAFEIDGGFMNVRV